ncbi:hypothetical protein KBB96_09845 [Luteolibacter ambystomatis]|uniref:Uncharacterized protein n=1 Tax=Luteolibacter ambystomatis TaxID=2824561 RepID=A0A975PGX5_9BACT|nr:hypothetical protein [Luteolibacter ambystomatis]QUE53183.1 hypothetical protein KBB96_09845 [Luteolibacter ambystomatis]
MARVHASAWATPKARNEIARRMFLHRFPEAGVRGMSIKQTYAELGRQFGVTWKARTIGR